jgi:hypothetical protein
MTLTSALFIPLLLLSQGFRQLKVVRGRNTNAFVEFDTVENATVAHNSVQVRGGRGVAAGVQLS